MRILLLTHAFNSLAQRFHGELTAAGHQVSVEFDINDDVTQEAVALFQPHLIVAPYLRRAIPASVWRNHLCWVVHPGVVGDRGPSALDWAILNGESVWGVTLLQAEAEMDAGPVWAAETFVMRAAMKSSLYRNEVTEAAVRALHTALARWPDYQAGRWQAQRVPLRPMHPRMTQADRAIDWANDTTARVLAKLRASDGFPGVRDSLFGRDCLLYHAHEVDAVVVDALAAAGSLLGRAAGGIVRATVDGAVWIGHGKRLATGSTSPNSPTNSTQPNTPNIKLPLLAALPELMTLPEWSPGVEEIQYWESGAVGEAGAVGEVGEVGYLTFNFYNGAMSTSACERVLAAYENAQLRPTKLIVLLGGVDFFSNGLDLNSIEAAESPADESWRNINAMDDLVAAIVKTQDRLVVSALRGNAGAGGAFLALAADVVWARQGVVLNPHYKNMGNLYGSEYWTYLLPRRIGVERAQAMMQRRLPLATAEAVRIGFLDASFADDVSGFEAEVARRATAIAQSAAWAEQLAAKQQRRAADEAVKPLATYRAEELKLMQRNFYGFDPGYHVARHHFVQKTPHSWTPRHLAIHREVGWQVTQPTTQPTAQQTDNPTIVISPENRDCVIARQPNK